MKLLRKKVKSATFTFTNVKLVIEHVFGAPGINQLVGEKPRN